MDIGSLTKKIGMSITQTYYLANNLSEKYSYFDMKKKIGGFRKISVPSSDLKNLQRRILHKFFYDSTIDTSTWRLLLPGVHSSSCGFVKNKSIIDNCRPHVGKRVVLKLDLEDFFGSIKTWKVKELLRDQFCLDNKASNIISQVVTNNGTLPQGAPTSPHLANLITRKMDSRLDALSRKNGLDYTRYADDLTFSGDKIKKSIFKTIRKIINEEGFRIKAKKTRITSNKNRQIVTGLIVNDRLNVPRKERRRIRAILHNCLKHGVTSQNKEDNSEFRSYLRGKISFIQMVNSSQGERLLKDFLKIDFSPLDPLRITETQTERILSLLRNLENLLNWIGLDFEKKIEISDFIPLFNICYTREDLSNHCIILNRVLTDKLLLFSKNYLEKVIGKTDRTEKAFERLERFIVSKGVNYLDWNEPLDSLNFLANKLTRHEPNKRDKTTSEEIFKRYCDNYPIKDYNSCWNNLVSEIIKRLKQLDKLLKTSCQ